VGTRTTESLPEQADCTAVELIGSDAITHYSVRAATWSNVNLSIRSERPLEVLLDAPQQLQHVFVQLSGPVLLRVADAASVVDLRVLGIASERGNPRLELEQVQAQLVNVGDAARSFPGELSLHASKLTVVALRADSVRLESVVLERGGLQTRALTAADVDLNELAIEAETAVVSAFGMRDSRLHICESGSFLDGRTSETAINTCSSATLRLYDVGFSGGALDGSIESDSSNFENVRIGVEAPTQLIAYASVLSSSSFCEHSERLALGFRTLVKCCACDERLDSASLGCAIDEPLPLDANACPAWPKGTRLPECSDDVPDRSRPRSESGR
jgi:hypothetical protein